MKPKSPAKMQLKVRHVPRKERWTKKCAECRRNYVPKEYRTCDTCFMAKFNFTTTYDALDHLGFTPLIPASEVLRVLRNICDGVSIEIP